MTSADSKEDSGSARQKKEQKNSDLESLQKTIDLQRTELSSYKNELAQALDRIVELENDIVAFRQKTTSDDKSAVEPIEFMEGDAVLVDLKVTPLEYTRPSIAIPCDRPFKLCMMITLPRPKDRNAPPLPWRLSVFAKQLAGGSRMIIGEIDANVMEDECVQACLVGKALQSGTYRFEVQAALDIPGTTTPYITRLEDGLINVY
ncbi:MAG: hypothetical protein HGB01_00180 [Chlorobiaceae bacterium]|nr:hypothetical protein [Chlorobiaceae bacterium]